MFWWQWSRCWLGLEDGGSFTRQNLHKKRNKGTGKKTRDTYNVATWFYTAFHDAVLLFHILPWLLLFGICLRKALQLPVEPGSVAGTTAPARAETSQLGGPGLSAFQLGLFWMVKVPYDHPIQRKNASSMFHLQVVFCFCYSFHDFMIIKRIDLKHILNLLEWWRPQPKKTWNKNASIPISLERGSSER